MVQTILIFSPHPDDAEFYAGGTIAKLIRQGARAVIVIATDGRCGSFEFSSCELADRRAVEACRAADILGADPPLFLAQPDMELDRLPPGSLRETFLRLIRKYQPAAVFSPDPLSPDPHPDHRQVAWAASDAIHYAALPLVHPEHRLLNLHPHFVPEKYFYTEHLPAANKYVDISDTIDLKLAALFEHESQVKFLVEDVLRQAALVSPPHPGLAGLIEQVSTNPAKALGGFLRLQAAEAGQKNGVPFAEAFRYERFHPAVESFLSASGGV